MKFPDTRLPIEQQDEDVLLAMLVWGEARGEPPEGRVAVAHVPLTRLKKRNSVRSSLNRKVTLRSIMLKRWQFSCFNKNDPNRVLLLRPVEAEGLGLWAACWRTAVEALMGHSANPAQGATHYVVRRLWSRPMAVVGRPQWFEHPLTEDGTTTFIAQVGSHVFARTA